MNSHKDLEVWKKAIALAKCIWPDKGFAREEVFALSDQMNARLSPLPAILQKVLQGRPIKLPMQFLYISLGSASELDTQIEICKAISFKAINTEHIEAIQNELSTISRMIYGLITKVKQNVEQSLVPGLQSLVIYKSLITNY
jgi:four helix bundle protein